MRFLSNGPSIPDLLLEQRDQGRVVFFCGAGVSLNAGMPTFPELTQHVVDFFDPPEDSDLAVAFAPWRDEKHDGLKTPLDQVWHSLYQEYGRDEVNALVAERLWCEAVPPGGLREHQLIARISSDQEANPQIVTTNFDRLFEQAIDVDPGKIYEPPAFPDIRLGVPISGITYLHGRLQQPDSKSHPYVLSSADLGRAYLSEAWATRFVRALLDTFTVVLIGYKAEDPPVQYLLQGLNHDDRSDRSNLYAFEKGTPGDIEAKWRDRGVTAIPYRDHDDLWETLGAWAERADNPRAWRTHVVDMARAGPRAVSPHERGQVAHLVRTNRGARLFANADPTPTAEWLCVFDAWIRAARKSKGFAEEADSFDPLEVYGLDDDPPRPPETGRLTRRVHDHLLEWRRGDTNPPTAHGLGHRQVPGHEDMPRRLFHLTRWIVKHLDEPCTAWWAVKQHGLHPRLIEDIRRELGRAEGIHPDARRAWNLILEYQTDHRRLRWDRGWFELRDRIRQDGWSPGVLRELKAVTAPGISMEPPLGLGQSKPPFDGWEETGQRELGRWEIDFPDQHGEEIEVPDEVLHQVYRIAEEHLRRSSGLLTELGTTYFTTPTCYPGRDVEGDDHHADGEAFFLWFLELFNRMVQHDPAALRSQVLVWPADDRFYFHKLRLYALNQPGVFRADEAAETVLRLDQEVLWDPRLCRELLFLISDRWNDFSDDNRRAVTDRLLDGPARRDRWSEEEYFGIRDESAARYTRWLVLQGREIAEGQSDRLNTIIHRIPDWNDRWATSITTEHGVIGGWVRVDETSDTVMDLSDAQVVDRALADLDREFGSLTDLRPFTGLVKANPRKALSSLTIKARKGNYPTPLWEALINEWPAETAPRLYRAFLLRLGRLPFEVIRELRYTIGRWTRDKLVDTLNFDRGIAWATFDHLVSGLVSDDGSATESGMGETFVHGEPIRQSRRTYNHAINGPIGEATEGLIRAIRALSPDEGAGIPDEYKTRLERLLTSPGEGRDHAVAIVSHYTCWFHLLYPEWVEARVIPWFNFEHPVAEPAWNGFLWSNRVPTDQIRVLLRHHLINLFPFIYSLHWERDLAKVAAKWFVWMAVFRPSHPTGVTINEARRCIRKMNDDTRSDVIFHLGRIGKENDDGWADHVIPFVTNVWPRERRFRTRTSLSSWVSLLDDTGDMLPPVLAAVRRFLVPVKGESHSLYGFTREIGDEQPLTVRHPGAVLDLLDATVPDDPDGAPHELAQVLSMIEETDPSLTSDRRYIRLIDLVDNR